MYEAFHISSSFFGDPTPARRTISFASVNGMNMIARPPSSGAGFIDAPADQGKMSTCSLYAVAHVINGVGFLRYGVSIPAADIAGILEGFTMQKGNPLFGVGDRSGSGATLDQVCKAINYRASQRGRYKEPQFLNKTTADRFCLKVRAEAVGFDQLLQIFKRGSSAGVCIAYVCAHLHGNRYGHSHHALAAFGAETGAGGGAIICQNSWGNREPLMRISREKFVHAYMVVPKLHFWSRSGRKMDIPKDEAGWTELRARWHALQKTKDVVSVEPGVSRGRVTFTDGRRYDGELLHHVPHGSGRMEFPTGSRYSGQWVSGARSGRGKYTRTSDGAVFTGEWKDDEMCGYGTFTLPGGGLAYEGGWKNGKKHGRGKRTYSDGRVYDGQWDKGVCHGRGRMVWPSGEEYDGEWKKGKQNGRGKLSGRNGFLVEGRWKEGTLSVEMSIRIPCGGQRAVVPASTRPRSSSSMAVANF